MLIEQKVHEQGRSVQWLAGRLSCHRTNVYDIFHRPTIDSMLLQRLCLILQYDFFSDLSVEVRKEMYPASLPGASGSCRMTLATAALEANKGCFCKFDILKANF